MERRADKTVNIKSIKLLVGQWLGTLGGGTMGECSIDGGNNVVAEFLFRGKDIRQHKEEGT